MHLLVAVLMLVMLAPSAAVAVFLLATQILRMAISPTDIFCNFAEKYPYHQTTTTIWQL